MWAWYKSQYILPKLQRLPLDGAILARITDNFLIVQNQTITTYQRQCSTLGILTKDNLDGLCAYCKNFTSKYVGNKDACVSFDYDNASKFFYQKTIPVDSFGMELPIYVLLGNPIMENISARNLLTHPKLDLAFSYERIKNNIETILSSREFLYGEKYIDIQMRWYATRKTTTSDSGEVLHKFLTRIKTLKNRFEKITATQFETALTDGSL